MVLAVAKLFFTFFTLSFANGVPAVRMTPQAYLQELSDVLSRVSGYRFADVPYTRRSPTRDLFSPIQRVRRLVGIQALCKLSTNKDQCFAILRSIRRQDIQRFDLGSKAVLGLAIHESPAGHGIGYGKWLSKSVASYYNVESGSWRVAPFPGAFFAIGEALTFLASQATFSELPWLELEIKKYAEAFRSTHDHLRVRWLLGSLYYAQQKNPDSSWVNDEISYVTDWLKTKQARSGCFYDQRTRISGQLSGLMLEGLSYFHREDSIDPAMKSISSGFLRCVLAQRPLRIWRRGGRIDGLGHAGNAVATMLGAPSGANFGKR